LPPVASKEVHQQTRCPYIQQSERERKSEEASGRVITAPAFIGALRCSRSRYNKEIAKLKFSRQPPAARQQ
jgi:hypothetical protein